MPDKYLNCTILVPKCKMLLISDKNRCKMTMAVLLLVLWLFVKVCDAHHCIWYAEGPVRDNCGTCIDNAGGCLRLRMFWAVQCQ